MGVMPGERANHVACGRAPSKLVPGVGSMGNRVLRRDDIARKPLYGCAQPYIRTALTGLAVAVAYYLSVRAGIALRFPPDNIAAFWPPATILLVALLMTPACRWWVVLLASLPPHVIALRPVGRSAFFPLVFGLLGWLGAWTATVALRRVGGEPWRLARLQDFYLYTLCAVIGGPVVIASAGAALQVLIQGSVGFWATWRMRFLANVLVHLTLSPALLIWITGGVGWLKSASPRRYGEACLLSVVLLAVGLRAFGGDTGSPDNLALVLYAPMPLLLWAAVRFGPRGATTALSFIACLLIWNAVHGRGPFTEQSLAENVLDLQLFLIVVAVPLLVLAILIQERQRTEEALRASEERYRTIVEDQTELICRYRPDTTLTFVNEAYCRHFGRTREELIGTSFLSLIPDEARQAALAHVQSLCEYPRIEPYEHPIMAANGKIRWQQWVDHLILDDNGRILELQAVGRDITERKQAGDALRLSEERYALAINAGKVGVWDWDIRTGAIYLDPILKALLGYEDDEIPNQLEVWVGHVHPEDRDRVMQVAQVCLEGGLPQYEIEHRRPGLHRPHAHGDVAVAGDENNRDAMLGRRQRLLQGQPAHPGHAHIQHQAARAVSGRALQELGGRGKRLPPQADGAHQPLQTLAHRGIVIDDEHHGLRFHHASSSLSTAETPTTPYTRDTA